MRPRIDHSADPPPDKILLPSDEEKDKDLYHHVGPVTRQFLGRPWHRCSDHNRCEELQNNRMKNNSERSRSNEVRIPMELDEKQHLADESATLLLDKGLPASAVAVKIGLFGRIRQRLDRQMFSRIDQMCDCQMFNRIRQYLVEDKNHGTLSILFTSLWLVSGFIDLRCLTIIVNHFQFPITCFFVLAVAERVGYAVIKEYKLVRGALNHLILLLCLTIIGYGLIIFAIYKYGVLHRYHLPLSYIKEQTEVSFERLNEQITVGSFAGYIGRKNSLRADEENVMIYSLLQTMRNISLRKFASEHLQMCFDIRVKRSTICERYYEYMQTINRVNETELASVQFFIDAPFTICDSFVSRLKAEEQVKRCPHNLWHNGAFLIIFFAVLIIGSGRRVDDGLKWIFYHSPDICSPNLDLRIYGIILSVFSLPGFTLFIKAGILTYYVFRSSLELQFVDKLAIYLCAAITMLFMLLQSPSALRNIRRDRQLRSEMKLMIENENKGETPHNKDELIDNEVIGHLGKLTEGYQSVKRAEIIRKMNGERLFRGLVWLHLSELLLKCRSPISSLRKYLRNKTQIENIKQSDRLNSKDLCSAIHFLDEDSRNFYKVLFGGFSEELTKYYGDMHKEASSKGAEFYGRLVRKLLRDELYLFDFFNDLDTAHEMLKIFNKELIEPQRQQEMSGDLEYVAYMIKKFSGKLQQCIQQNEAEINWLDPPEVVKTLREVEGLKRSDYLRSRGYSASGQQSNVDVWTARLQHVRRLVGICMNFISISVWCPFQEYLVFMILGLHFGKSLPVITSSYYLISLFALLFPKLIESLYVDYVREFFYSVYERVKPTWLWINSNDRFFMLMIAFLIGCRPSLTPLFRQYTANNGILKDSCNAKCNCNDSLIYPVCSSSGQMFLSPCHAGCPFDMHTTSDPPKRVEQLTLHNCICSNGTDMAVSRAYCPEDVCVWALCIFFVAFFLKGVLQSITLNQLYLFDERDKQLLSINPFLYTRTYSVPFFAITCWLIDQSCEKKVNFCGDWYNESCLNYDTDYQRKYMVIPLVLFVLLPTALQFVQNSWIWKSLRIKIWKHWKTSTE